MIFLRRIGGKGHEDQDVVEMIEAESDVAELTIALGAQRTLEGLGCEVYLYKGSRLQQCEEI